MSDVSPEIVSLQRRMKGLAEWLPPECFTEQKHCQEGTQERVYWHYGYYVALRDVLNLFGASEASKGLGTKK